MKWLRREFVTHLKKCFLECQVHCQFFARGIIYENQISSRKQGTIFQQLTKFLDLLSRVFIKNSSSRRNVWCYGKILLKGLFIWIKNSHGLPKVCWRILHRKWRILQSPAPNELPGWVFLYCWLFLYFICLFIFFTLRGYWKSFLKLFILLNLF